MAFDFPASPAVGAVYTDNGVSYVWNGYAWVQDANLGIPDAPSNGKAYVRKSGNWSEAARESSATKLWGYYTWGTGVPVLGGSFSVTSLTDTAVGNLTIHHAVSIATGPAAFCNTWARTNWSNKAEGVSVSTNSHMIYAIEAGALCDPAIAQTQVQGNLI